jgi:superfamily II DNA or RNA helicase
MKITKLHSVNHSDTVSKITFESKQDIKNMLVEKNDYLTKRGYAIFKEEYGLKQIEKIKRDLLVVPFVAEDYGAPPPSFPVYLESAKKLYLPKHWALKELGCLQKITTKEPVKINCKFVGGVRDNQMEPIKNFLDSCNLEGEYNVETLKKFSYGGIISLPCGWGKTVIGLYLCGKLGVKTLIIVHKEFLVNQWKERILQFIPDAKIGLIQQNITDVIGKDIVIGMLQSISMKDYPEWIFDEFGFTILDECHHLGAEVFSRALPKVNSKYILGLSATPHRTDGLNKVFEWYLGPYVFAVKEQNKRKVRVNMIYYNNPNPLYSGNENLPNGKPCLARMTNNITEFNRRNELILEIMRRTLIKDGTHVLALSDRREHLKYLHEQIDERKISSVGYYVGGMKQKDLKESESKRFVLGTFTMAAEALDIATLNTLLLMTSHSGGSVHTQSCGRILRKDHGEITPTIWDIVDDFSTYKNQAKKRMEYYKKQNYDIFKVFINDHDDTPISELLNNLDKMESVSVRKERKKLEKPKLEEIECLIKEDDDY